jgi:hypothetical protein
MIQRKDSSPTRRTPTLPVSHAERGKATGAPSGRVAFDARGNAVWEMRTGDHRYSVDSSTTLVRRLVPPLSLETTNIVKKVSQTPVPAPAVPQTGGEKLDRRQMGTVRTYPVRPSAVAARGPVSRTVAKPRAKAGLLERWLGRGK